MAHLNDPGAWIRASLADTAGPDLSSEQQHAADEMLRFADEGCIGVDFVLHGLAGTGKTTVLAYVARRMPGAKLVALTGKAASVLRAKTGLQASTVHSLFYELIGETLDATGRRNLEWRRANRPGALAGRIVLIDEASMIDTETAADIRATGARIIACGDPGQLPPVRGQQAFSRATLTLTEIHRQALESPIVRQAHRVRRGARYEADGDGFQVKGSASEGDLLAADKVLCWRNETRHALNAQFRWMRDIAHLPPQPGEPIVALRNRPWKGIYNGAVYILAEPFDPATDTSIVIEIDGVPTLIRNVVWGVPPMDCPDPSRKPIGFEYGYALTVHKSQGSEWDDVLLVDEYDRADARIPWLYTGITRAAKRCLIVGARK